MSRELLDVFVAEGRELVEQALQDLEALDGAPRDTDLLGSVFRSIHTLKGSAGLVGFAAMERLYHAAEDRLVQLRRDGRPLDEDFREKLQELCWRTEAWLDATARNGRLPDISGEETATPSGRSAQAAEGPSPHWAMALLDPGAQAPGPFTAFRYVPRADGYFAGDDPVATVKAAPGLIRLQMSPREPFGALELYDPFACNLVLCGLCTAPLSEVDAAFRFVRDQVVLTQLGAAAKAPEERPAAPSGAGRSLRVEAERIDALAAATDELVVAKNALSHAVAKAAPIVDPVLSGVLTAAQAALDRQVSRLHEQVTRLRLVPLATLFRRFPGLVRQTAQELGKEADLTLAGEDVELDKSIADGLYEPLLHLVRNALDHGVDSPAERAAAGKPQRASLRLSARAESDEAVIELSDDGPGLDLKLVRSIAEARGVASREALEELSDMEAADLVFAPGFSTRTTVSELSGRGVGLDAVRSAMTRLGGRVEIHSRSGAGVRVVLTLPLRVRLARLMIVEAGGETFGVPLETVIETARIDAARVADVRAGRALVWREQAAPVFELSELLMLAQARRSRDELRLLIVANGDEMAAVSVDSIGGRLEAPVRPLAGALSQIPGVAGTTLLGDGSVLMVLDLPELVG